MTLRDLDSAISDTALQEQGIVAEHIFLMEQAMGLGGGIHSVGSGRHLPRHRTTSCSRTRLPVPHATTGPRRPNPVGLPGVWEAPCPPLIGNMEEAVLNLIASKFGRGRAVCHPRLSALEQSVNQTANPGATLNKASPPPSHFASTSFRPMDDFPPHVDAFKSIVACQAHHLDLGFYDKYYPPAAVSQSHHEHLIAWHEGEACRDRHQQS